MPNAGAGPRGPSIDKTPGPRARTSTVSSQHSQSTAQIALANTQHTNLIALHTAPARALATKGGDKDSKLTAAKRCILQACTGIMHVDEFEVEQVFRDMDAKGGTADALGRSFGNASGRSRSPPTRPTSTSPPKWSQQSSHSTSQPMATRPMWDARKASPSLRYHGARSRRSMKTWPRMSILSPPRSRRSKPFESMPRIPRQSSRPPSKGWYGCVGKRRCLGRRGRRQACPPPSGGCR